MTTAGASAIIAGGGIGGVAAALALAKAGIASRVCERRAAFPEDGAGIQIGPNGVRILSELGVADLLRPHAATPDALSVRDARSARELTRLPLGPWIAERHGAPYWTAHRRDLHAALRRRAETEPLVTLSPGCEIASFTEAGDGVRVTTTSHETFAAPLLVAADGLWSTLRSEISSAVKAAPQPIGKSAFRTTVAAERLPDELLSNTVHIWLAPSQHVVHYPVSGGREIALVVIADDTARGDTSREWDAAASADAVAQYVEGLAAPLRALLAAGSNWRRWSLHDMAPLERWSTGRAVLLGDAAHPVLPFLAQGAVMALEDAATLSASLTSARGDIATGLQRYADLRRRRVARVADASRRNGGVYHMAGSMALARNIAMKALPAQRVMAGFDWLYGWRAPC